MKTMHINTVVRLFLITLFLYSVFTAQAQQINLTLTPVNGTCVSDCQINASATGTTGAVTYSLINYPTVGQNTTPQASGQFPGLLPGTYTVGVYDATTAGVPVTKSVTVTTNYVPLLANTPVVSSDLNNYCNDNGSLNISFTGGKAPFRIKITNTTTSTPLQVTGITARSYTFTSLNPGDYIFEVEDACGQWIQNAPGTYAIISSSGYNLSSTTFSSVTCSNVNTYLRFAENGNCSSNVSLSVYYNDLKIYLNGSTTNYLPMSNTSYPQIKIRIEYPAGSGNYSSWQNIYSWPSFSITNFDRSQTDGDKYCIEVQHPCSGLTTTSPAYTIGMPVFTYSNQSNTSSYCSQDLIIRIGGSNMGNARVEYVDGCGPYTVELKDATTNALIDTQNTPASGNSTTQVVFTNIALGTYTATITGPNGFSQTLNNITVTLPTYNVIFIEFDNISGGYIGYYNRGYNTIFCDYTTTALGYWSGTTPNIIPGQPVTFSIEAVSPTPAITLPPVILYEEREVILWDNIPWGTYDITVDYGCIAKVFRKSWAQKVSGFTVASLQADNSIVCGSSDLVADTYYHLNGNRITNYNEAYRYWMLIVDGPTRIGERVMGYSPNTTSYPGARLSNLPGGTYKVLFYPYEIPVSTQIVNGKTVANYPTTMRSCYEERTITIPDYVRPIIDIPMSGGITCTGSGTTNLTVNVLQGSKPPFLYRYKVKGASDATYTPANFQLGNIFPGLSNGDYTVQIKDDCGSITTQDVRIFDGNEQFVGIIGEVLPGVVCETREVTLSVLSIGPVQSYMWQYRPNSSSSWTTLPSTSATYVIPSANQSHKGQYKVTINNGLCDLDSDIEIIEVLPPPGTPYITSPNSVICLGGSTTLTANTSLTSPNYQWYKDGLPVGTNSSTYPATAAGSYTVVVTPSLGCPSDPSAAFVVTEQIPAHPDAGDLSAVDVCNGGHPVIHLATSLAGVTYTAYTASSGGSAVGSVVGTGSAVDITLTTTPSSSVTYYIGATLNSCNSASRTPVTVTVVPTPAAPTVNSVPPICAGTTFSIDISSPNSSYSYKVYNTLTGGVPTRQSTTGSGTISDLTAPTSSTTYYVSAVVSAGCESNRTAVSITINAATAIMISIDEKLEACYGMNTTLTVNASGFTNPIFRWYSSQTEPRPFYTGQSYTTSNLTADTTFYISVEDDNYCENIPGDRKEITVKIVPCANDDRVTTFPAIPVRIDVLANDSIPNSCSPTPSIVAPFAKHGAPTMVNDSVQYTANAGFTGYDTVTYQIVCGSDISTANVIIHVQEFPDNVTDADCYVTPPATVWSVEPYMSYGNIDYHQIPMVGDFDGDDHPDILLIAIEGAATSKDFVILRGPNFDAPVKHTTRNIAGLAEAIGRIKWDETKDSVIYVVAEIVGSNTVLTAYNINGNELWQSVTLYSPSYATNVIARAVGLADFNNDGYAEVYVGNQIFDAITGIELCNGGNYNSGVSLYGNTVCGIFSVAMDVVGDRRLELCAGNHVYEVNINSRTNPALNSMSVTKQITPKYNSTNLHNDGATVVADFDNDGELEILVQTQANATTTGSYGYLYIWKPSTEKTLLVHQLTNASSRNVPFVGDINGDGKIEIVVLTQNLMRAFAIVNNNNNYSLSQLWQLSHSDSSGSTGLTLFDFNQDGIAEIVYRDQTLLRVINGSLKSHRTGADTTVVYNLFSTTAYSGTMYEYPIVADVNGDGHAEILFTSTLVNNPNNRTAKLHIYKGTSEHLWAPARKVWNQYMYNVVNVNEDLTIPRYQMSPAMVFPGKDGIIGTADDIQPYNNFLQQQTTILGSVGTPVWITPDAKFAETPPVFNYYGNGDSLVISLKLTNIGDAPLAAPFYISAYKNTVAATNKMATDNFTTILNVEDTMLVNVTIRNFSSHTSLNKIIIRINDQGSAAYIQQECNYDNNTFEYNPAKLPKAANDTVAILINTPVFIDVKLNDLIPTYCSSVKPIVVVAPTTGNITEIVDDSIKYTPDSDFYGVDSLIYRLECTSNDTVYNTEAKVYIIVNKPTSDAYIACADSIVTAGFVPVGNVTYHWYADETGGTQDGLAMNTRDCTAPSVWWVEARYKNNPVKPRINVSISAYPDLDLTGFSIGDDDEICNGATTAQLKAIGTPVGGKGTGTYKYQWQQSADGVNGWTDIKDSTSATLTPPVLTSDTYYRLNVTSCETKSSNTVKITVRSKSLYNYPDIRIRACPDPGKLINLSKYIDTLSVTFIEWKSVSPAMSIINTEAGTISADALSTYTKVYTFSYTVRNPCIANDITRRVYLEPLRPDRMRPLQDSIVICYEYAEALQINQIFGIDARGKWSFEAFESDCSTTVNIDAYVKESKSPTFEGAVIMNGKAIYENTSARKVLVTYTPADDSCLKNSAPFKIMIVLEN